MVIPIGRPGEQPASFRIQTISRRRSVFRRVHVSAVMGWRGVILDRPDLTAERFVPNPFSGWPAGVCTAPVIGAVSTGWHRRISRPRGQSSEGAGIRIELGEIEAQLRNDGQVKDAVVVVRPEAEARSNCR